MTVASDSTLQAPNRHCGHSRRVGRLQPDTRYARLLKTGSNPCSTTHPRRRPAGPSRRREGGHSIHASTVGSGILGCQQRESDRAMLAGCARPRSGVNCLCRDPPVPRLRDSDLLPAALLVRSVAWTFRRGSLDRSLTCAVEASRDGGCLSVLSWAGNRRGHSERATSGLHS